MAGGHSQLGAATSKKQRPGDDPDGFFFEHDDAKNVSGSLGGIVQDSNTLLEPDQNFSQFMSEKKMAEQENEVLNEEWN